jgi:ribosomal protein S18 acetylase RimI-like enzyme
MDLLHSSSGIEYRRFERLDLDAMSRALAESFCLGEPMAVALGLSYQEIYDIVRLFGPKAAAEGVTIVASAANGALVGALLAQDFATPLPQGLEQVARAFAPIGALLDGLDEEYRRGREVRKGTHLHLFMIGVLTPFSGKKIAQELLATSLNNGIARGYQTALTEATGALSQHIFRKEGFTDRQVARYADFAFDQELVFRSIRTPEGAVLMDKQLHLPVRS